MPSDTRTAVLLVLAIGFPFAAGGEAGSGPEADAAARGKPALARYERDARELVERIEGGASHAELRERAADLMSFSRGILGDFAIHYPPCGPYFRATFELREHLDSISLEALERDYHADGRLPAAPAFCYHAKDFFVHPATVLVLLREGDDRAQMGAEINEALLHVAAVRALLPDPEPTAFPPGTPDP